MGNIQQGCRVRELAGLIGWCWAHSFGVLAVKGCRIDALYGMRVSEKSRSRRTMARKCYRKCLCLGAVWPKTEVLPVLLLK
jgi:hypothetical protein